MRVNLLPHDERPLKSSTVRIGFVVAVLGAVLLLVIAGFSIFGNMQVKQLQSQYTNMVRSIDLLEKQKKQLDALQAAIGELKLAQEQYQGVMGPFAGGQQNLIDYIGDAVSKTPPGIYLERVAFYDGKVHIEGYTRDLSNLSHYIQVIKQSTLSLAVERLEPHETSGFTQFLIQVEEGV